jgi:guanylate kinase
MIKRIILVGKAAAGKDHLRKVLESLGFVYAVSYTTRPPRDGEIDGKDYIFLSEDEAERMVDAAEFYEYVYFNGWLYGTSNQQFYSDDIFIMTPKGLSHVSDEDRKESFVIFLDIDDETRHQRLLSREMPGDSIQRRMEADSKDFDSYKDFDMRIYNPDFTVEDVQKALEFMGIIKTTEQQ